MDRNIVAASALAAGVAVGGLLVGAGFARGRSSEQYVTVKGVSERTVKADLAIWPVQVVAADDDLARASASLERSMQQIRHFLARQRVDATQTAVQGFSVSDARTNQYGSNERAGSRYVIRQTLVVRSTEPDLVLAASQRVAEPVNAGVVLSSGGEYGSGGPTFLFSRLNDLKPAMIAEATQQARRAAEQFARDASSEIGGIRRANQGVFEILPRDQAMGISEASQIEKTVRVVSTVDFFLKD